MSRNSSILTATLAVALMLVASCSRKTVYSHYEHTPLLGWEKGDTLFFDVRPVSESGTYREDVGLRLDGLYPFMSLQLTVEQTIQPLGHLRHDTLNCSLIDHGGLAKGDGVSYYQYNFHLTTLELNRGDSLHICVRHNMKREMLQGISDVGISLRRE